MTSTGYLDSLWSDAVKGRDELCLFCGGRSNLQAHHINTRTHRTTRWDHRNGITVCVNYNPKLKMTCHQYAHSKTGDRMIEQFIGERVFLELDQLARTTIKDLCKDRGITYNEFKNEKKEELKTIINSRTKISNNLNPNYIGRCSKCQLDMYDGSAYRVYPNSESKWCEKCYQNWIRHDPLGGNHE